MVAMAYSCDINTTANLSTYTLLSQSSSSASVCELVKNSVKALYTPHQALYETQVTCSFDLMA